MLNALFIYQYLSPVFPFSGESDDDHEELLAAANAALNTSTMLAHVILPLDHYFASEREIKDAMVFS